MGHDHGWMEGNVSDDGKGMVSVRVQWAVDWKEGLVGDDGKGRVSMRGRSLLLTPQM